MRMRAAAGLLLACAAAPAVGYSYKGKLTWGAYDVGAPEQLRLTHTADPAARYNETCAAAAHGVSVSWVSQLAAAAPKAYDSVQDYDGDNASMYYAEVQLAAGVHAAEAEFLAARPGTHLAYAHARVENRCGTLRLMSSVEVRLGDRTGADAPFSYRVRNAERRGANNTMFAVNAWSKVMVGRVPRQAKASWAELPPTTFAIVADMSDYMSTQGTVNAIHGVTEAVAAGEVAAMVHIGDLAYDIDDDCGRQGDEFLRRVEGISARVPYIFGPGDHEGGRKSLRNINCGGDYEMFMHKLSEGQLPLARASGSPTLFYFSFDVGHVHFVVVNANAWVYACQYWMLRPMMAWLEGDLSAVDRERTPWVVVLAHRQAYCVKSEDAECNQEARALRYGVPREAYDVGLNMGDWAAMGRDVTGHEGNVYGLEAVLHRHDVDIYFGGHTHHYERSWPSYRGAPTQRDYVNPGATVYVQGGLCGVTSDAFVLPQSPFEAWRDERYLQSWGRVTAHNATHLTWVQVRADGQGVLDAFTIVRQHAPQGTRPREGGEEGWPRPLALPMRLLSAVLAALALVAAVASWRRSLAKRALSPEQMQGADKCPVR